MTDAEKARSSISVHFRNVCAFDFEFTFPFIHPSNKNLEKSNGNDKPPKHISEMNRGDEIKSAKNGQREGGEGEFFVTCSTTNASVLGGTRQSLYMLQLPVNHYAIRTNQMREFCP